MVLMTLMTMMTITMSSQALASSRLCSRGGVRFHRNGWIGSGQLRGEPPLLVVAFLIVMPPLAHMFQRRRGRELLPLFVVRCLRGDGREIHPPGPPRCRYSRQADGRRGRIPRVFVVRKWPLHDAGGDVQFLPVTVRSVMLVVESVPNVGGNRNPLALLEIHFSGGAGDDGGR